MPYAAYTLTTLRTRLLERYDGNPFWTNEEARLALNEGLRLWNLLVGQWRRRVTLETAASTWDYALPATMLWRTRVTWNDRPLHVTSVAALDRLRRGWRTETIATGSGVPQRVMLWAPVSLYLIHIWPSDTAAANSLVIDGVADTPIMVNTGDYVDLGDDLLGVLLDYALHALSFKRGMPAIQATLPLLTAFFKAAAAQNSMLTASKLYRKYMGLDHQREIVPLVTPPPVQPIPPTMRPGTL